MGNCECDLEEALGEVQTLSQIPNQPSLPALRHTTPAWELLTHSSGAAFPIVISENIWSNNTAGIAAASF